MLNFVVKIQSLLSDLIYGDDLDRVSVVKANVLAVKTSVEWWRPYLVGH